MATKHNVRDADIHFTVNPVTRNIDSKTSGKMHLMQYDHNSEVFTFEIPRYIEQHDMAQCDSIQVHYENTSAGTSASLRKTYRGICTIDKSAINTDTEDVITFGWLVPDSATMIAGSLKFQLKFICLDNEDENIIGYRWHSNVNNDIAITAGLSHTEEDLPPSATAMLQSLEINEIREGVEIILDGIKYYVYHGGYSDEVMDTVELKANKTMVLDRNSTSVQYPSAAAVYDLVEALISDSGSAIKTIDGSSLKFFVGTQAEYDALTDTEKNNVFALITDDISKEDILEAIEKLKTDKVDKSVIAGLTSTVENHTTTIGKLETDVESILGGNVVYAKGLSYRTVAEGSFVAGETIISTTNFIKPNTRYVLVLDDTYRAEGFSDAAGTSISFACMVVSFGLSDPTELLLARIYYSERIPTGTYDTTTGVMYTGNVYDLSSSLGVNQHDAPNLTKILECEQIPM